MFINVSIFGLGFPNMQGPFRSGPRGPGAAGGGGGPGSAAAAAAAMRSSISAAAAAVAAAGRPTANAAAAAAAAAANPAVARQLAQGASQVNIILVKLCCILLIASRTIAIDLFCFPSYKAQSFLCLK